MGNVAFCAPSMISNGGVKVVSSDGRLMIYTRAALRAAEIMQANPGQFLCDSTHLRVGHRIPGLCPEEDLERGQLYFLLPMEMLYSVLTDDEMNSLTHQDTSKLFKQLLNFSNIFPECCLFPNNNSEVKTAAGGGADQPRNLSRQRSWEPALETILETPPHT